METRMRLYEIRFGTSMHLSQAFDMVLTVSEVDSCVVESEARWQAQGIDTSLGVGD